MDHEHIRPLFAHSHAQGQGMSEGAALSACASLNGPLKAVALRPEWLAQLQALKACGPLAALTCNDHVVLEKTGVYRQVSASGPVGMALGDHIDLRLFFDRWHAGFAVTEASAVGNAPRTSLQYFDWHGRAVHKVMTCEQTDSAAWQSVLEAALDAKRIVHFTPSAPATSLNSLPAVFGVPPFGRACSAMTDTHQFFPQLNQFGRERRHGFGWAHGPFAHRVENGSVREMLMEAAFDGTPIMCFVGSPGCIQIHTGPVRRVEPVELPAQTWLHVLDEGFSMRLREDALNEVWVVEKPTADGVVTSLEAFDARGEPMAMFFGARKPGQAEPEAWRHLLAHLQAVDEPQQSVLA
jgi:putative hemin transport protein